MKIFNKKFSSYIKSDTQLLDIIIKYLIKRKGKQIRPKLVFLISQALNNITESTYRAAIMVELLHTATLVHDDVVDESFERRGSFSINALWRSKGAVLTGDYMLAKGLLISLENKEYEMLDKLSNAVKNMSEGELQQAKNSRKGYITEYQYFEVINMKTASLFRATAECAAISSTSDNEIVNKISDYSYHLGMIFQLTDDLLDFRKYTGKPIGTDTYNSKLTLPVIYCLDNCSNSDIKELQKLRKKSKKKGDITKLKKFIEKAGGFEYTQKVIDEHKQSAINNLNKLNNIDTSGLKDLALFVSNRAT